MGADTLLIDEDTCANNAMIRDTKMMQLVANEKEPITPLVRVAPALFREHNVSFIMVIGGAGDFFDIADRVLLMDSYTCVDVTDKAKEISRAAGSSSSTAPAHFGSIQERYLVNSQMLSPDGKVKTQNRGVISYGEVELDLRALEQIVSVSQTTAIASALQTLAASGSQSSVRASLTALDKAIDEQGLDVLAPNQFHGGLTRARILEIGGALNRLRRDGTITSRR